jgi:hypothetical protein
MQGMEHKLKRVFAAVAVSGLAGLAACSGHTAPPAAAGHATHGSVRVPVSCAQQYKTWKKGQGKGVIAALHAVSSAETAGDTRVLTATLKRTRPALSQAAHHPVPACADPRGYWDVLLMHVTAAAAGKGPASSVRAAMKAVPKIEHQLTAELKQAAAP